MPSTTNIGLNIPNTGDLVGTWGSGAINPDMAVVDGYFGGVQTLTPSGGSLVLTAPSGFTPTPSGGPTQAQTGVLKFTGSPASNATITLPLPGYYIIDNQLANTSSALLILRAAAAGQVIAVDKGSPQHVYNDGTNVRFVNLGGIVGEVTIWAGRSSVPAWISACSVPPYLLCDGTVYNASQFPYLFGMLGGQFGGNGSTTFAVPDLRGRVALPYDGTGNRITGGVSGINGQSIGSAADNQGVTLTTNQIPVITSGGNNNISVGNVGTSGIPLTSTAGNIFGGVANGTGGTISVPASTSASWQGTNTLSGINAILVTSNTGGQAHSNVQPAQVTGIAVIRAA